VPEIPLDLRLLYDRLVAEGFESPNGEQLAAAEANGSATLRRGQVLIGFHHDGEAWSIDIASSSWRSKELAGTQASFDLPLIQAFLVGPRDVISFDPELARQTLFLQEHLDEVEAALTGDAGRDTYTALERLARHRAQVRWTGNRAR
jgi:hypothetical protein